MRLASLVAVGWIFFAFSIFATPFPPGVTPLTGLDPMMSDMDLQLLGQRIGAASIVGLGESQHTSEGYHQAKFRLIRYLVEKLGFRMLGMETPRIQAIPASEYVRSCQGSADDAAQSVFSVFRSRTTRRMFRWL